MVEGLKAIAEETNHSTRDHRRDRQSAGPETRLRLQRRGVRDGLRPEQQQLGPASPTRSSTRGGQGPRCGDVPAHDGKPGRKFDARSFGTRSTTPRGMPDQACSSTRRSTRGTRARARADQREQPVLGVHVPRQHGVQPSVAERAEVLRRDARVRRGRVRARDRPWTIVLEISVLMAKRASPAARSRNCPGSTTLGLGYANLEARCSCRRGSRTTAKRPAVCCDAHEHPDRAALVPAWSVMAAKVTGRPFRASSRPGQHAASSVAPPPGGRWRARATENLNGLGSRRCPWTTT